jgi:hypothetical protein
MSTEDIDIAETVATAYGERILKLLGRVREVCTEAGLYCPDEPFDMSADDFRWCLKVFRTEDENDYDQLVDVSVQIAEAREYGDEPEDGINFGLDIVKWGGRILGGLTPYNYTEHCWVSAHDSEAIEERFRIIEDSYLGDIPDLINS